MALGFFPPPTLVANAATLVYGGPPVGKVGIVCLAWVNLGGSGNAKIAIAVSRAAIDAIPLADWVTYDRTLATAGEFEKMAVQVSPGEVVYVRASTTAVCVRTTGYERTGVGSSTTATPNAGVIVPLFACPAGKVASGGILLCNRLPTSANVSIAIALTPANAIPASAWITFGRKLAAQAEYEKNGLVIYPGETAYFKSDAIGVNVRSQFCIGG